MQISSSQSSFKVVLKSTTFPFTIPHCATFAKPSLIALATSKTEDPFSTSLIDPSFKVILIIFNNSLHFYVFS